LAAADILDFGAQHVAVATGATWRRDGVGRENGKAIQGFDHPAVFTPDDIMSGKLPTIGPVGIFDDDHYYMGGVIAERCVQAGLATTLVTPAIKPSAWTDNTLEATKIARHLAKLGVKVIRESNIITFSGDHVLVLNHIDDQITTIAATSVITVTARLPQDQLYLDLQAAIAGHASPPVIKRIGDCLAASTIQAAVYSGHRYARELDDETASVYFPRELPKAPALRRHWGA
jgi:dimethylamine/trimethylamine dehydrogenase